MILLHHVDIFPHHETSNLELPTSNPFVPPLRGSGSCPKYFFYNCASPSGLLSKIESPLLKLIYHQHETSNLQPRTSNLELPTSNLEPPTSNFQPRTSNLQPRTSFVPLPSSRLTSYFVPRTYQRLIISLNFTVCLRLTSIFSPPFRSSNKPPLK